MNVLSINPGSSSLKFALHQIKSVQANRCLVRGAIDRLGTPEATLRLSDSSTSKPVQGSAVGAVIEDCFKHGAIDAVGVRVVHGGRDFGGPAVVDERVLGAIRSLSPLAPLHNARDVETIETVQKAMGDIPVVAVFDTAFHRTIPWFASEYAIPRELAEKHGIQRYGFHGISYRYVAGLLRPYSKLVICHLGSGASVCALLDGKSVDTSMGMTPLEGLVMATRSGDVDPGLILFLERELKMSASEVDEMLNHKSGLAGLFGLDGDVRDIEQAAENGNANAERALEVFAYRVAKYIGAYAVALEGLEALAFCGGIGENSPKMRSRICRRLGFLGVSLDQSRNGLKLTEDATEIRSGNSISVWVVKTDEEQQIAKESFALLSAR